MKRRHYLICSIIAILSIVSYACETEYAICEGCEGTGGDGNGPSENVCIVNSQKCAESLNGRQVCKGSKWENDEACNYCFNENTSNEGVKKVDCGMCTPNSYDEFRTKVCYKGDFKKFELKKDDNNPNSGVVINSKSKSDDALWEFAFNKTVTKSDSWEYYNCHNASVLEAVRKSDFKNISDGGAREVYGCCVNNDYYIKRIGYSYYSVEKCEKVETDGIPADFWAYEYTDELNNMLIGKKRSLPYSLCYNVGLLISNKNISKKQHSAYKLFACPLNYGCNEKYDELCVIEKFEYNDEMEFKCEVNGEGIPGGESITYGGISVAKCPAKTTLEIQNIDGSWSACNDLKFKLNQARCVPLDIKVGTSPAAPK